jgi:tRNA dimethylallyltransferase
LDIGTAKPDRVALEQVPHHLLNICDPDETYSAARFSVDAQRLIAEISRRGCITLLAGGTMLYFRALFKGLSELPAADAEVRQEIEEAARQKGWHAMHEELEKIDPQAAQRIHPNDPQRMQRALEVYYLTGRPLSELQQRSSASRPDYQHVCYGLMPQARGWLHERIALRWQQMLDGGLIEEVRSLMSKGNISADLPSMRSVGYRQVWRYLSGELDYAQMVEKGLVATRQLAKRQMTWMRGEQDMILLDPAELSSQAIAARIVQEGSLIFSQ